MSPDMFDWLVWAVAHTLLCYLCYVVRVFVQLEVGAHELSALSSPLPASPQP